MEDESLSFTAELVCFICLFEWEAHFPDGLAEDAKITCPKCGYENEQHFNEEPEGDDDDEYDGWNPDHLFL